MIFHFLPGEFSNLKRRISQQPVENPTPYVLPGLIAKIGEFDHLFGQFQCFE
jgi:hypothetical protein